MRTVGANLKAHLAQEVTTLSRCWEITRTDSTVFRCTDHDADIEVGGNTYQSVISGEMSAIQSGDNLAVGGADVNMMLSSSGLTAADIAAGRYESAEFWVFVVDHTTPADGYMTLAYGNIGQTELHDNHVQAEFRGLAHKLQQNIGRIYTALCDAEFGDTRCGLDLDALGYKESGTVAGVTNRVEFSGSTAGGSAYANGNLVWTSGDNNALEMEIKTFASNDFVLAMPMPFNVSVSDGYTAYYGCAKTREACKAYSNIVNYRGFPDMPGLGAMLESPDSHG